VSASACVCVRMYIYVCMYVCVCVCVVGVPYGEVGDHGVKIKAYRARIIVAVGLNGQARIRKHVPVVGCATDTANTRTEAQR
jgi:hypothetical protein